MVRRSDLNPGLPDGRPRCKPDNHAHLVAFSENILSHRGDRKPSPVMITCCILTLVPCFQAKRLESKWVKSGYVLDRKLALPYFYLIGDLSQSTSSQKSRKKQTVKYCFIFWLKFFGISSADLVMTNFECWIYGCFGF